MNKEKTKTEEKENKGKKEKRSDKGFRSYFFRVFGKYDFQDKEQFVRFGKWLLFIILTLVEILLIMDSLL